MEYGLFTIPSHPPERSLFDGHQWDLQQLRWADELGFSVTQDPVHVHDLQATILHQLGFDHERLTFRFQGRDYRLTDVFGKVVQPLLA